MAQHLGAIAALLALGMATTSTAAAQGFDASIVGEGSSEEPERDTTEGDAVDFETGGNFGYERLDEINYLAPTLTGDLRLSFFQSAIRVPLRLDASSGDIRDKDWDEGSDFFRIGRCVRMDFSSRRRYEREQGLCLPWDVHRDDYYMSLRMGPVSDFDLGHGTLLRAYNNNLDPDHYQAGVIGDLQFHQFVHSKLIIDNVTRPELIGATFSLQPFAYEADQTAQRFEFRHNFRLQVTAVSDLGAPVDVRTAFGEALTDEAGNLLYRRRPVTAVGADLRYRFVFGEQIELEARADWNWLVDHGMGGHAQVWWIYNHPDRIYSVRGLGEFRYLQDDYIPNYFDSFYFIQRQQYGLSPGAQRQVDAILTDEDGVFTTKQEYLAALPGGDWKMGVLGGVQFEAYRGSGDDRRTAVRARLFLSDVFGRSDDGQFLVTLEVPRLNDHIDVYAMFARQNFDDLVDIFSLDNTLIKLLVRYDLSEQMYLLMNYGRIWQLEVNAEGRTADGFDSNNEFGISFGFAEEITGGEL